MAESRIRIGKQTEKSVSPQSIVKTNASNEQEYLAPGADGTILTIVAGVPTFQAPVAGSFTLSDGLTTQIINSGDTLVVNSGNGILATVSATDTLNIAARLSTDANNSMSFGTDGGIFFNAANHLTGVIWNDTLNRLEFTYDINGVPTMIPVVIADVVGTFLADFTIAGDTGSDLVSNHETVTFAGGIGLTSNVTANTVTFNLEIKKEVFTNLSTGSTVTATGGASQIISVTRNGLEQHLSDDYTVAGAVYTFIPGFGVSGGAAGTETIVVTYVN